MNCYLEARKLFILPLWCSKKKLRFFKKLKIKIPVSQDMLRES